MPHLITEVSDPDKSILFIVGENNPLIPYLVEEYKKDFKIALVSSTPSKIPATPAGRQEPTSDIYIINPTNAALVKNLKEKIEYAIVFLEDSKVKEYIGPIFEKFVDDKTKTAVVCPVDRLNEFSDVANAVKSVPFFYFLFEGDVYSQIPEFNNSQTSKLIDEAVHNKEVILSGNDLQPLYPIYYKDAIAAMTQILIGPVNKDKYYYFFYKQPATYISAIHLLQRVEPDLKITYSDGGQAERHIDFFVLEKELEEKLLVKPVFIPTPQDAFEKSISHFVKRGPITKEAEAPSIVNTPRRIVREQKGRFKLLTSAAIYALLFFIVIQVAAAFATFYLFRNSLSDFQKGEYKKASNAARSSKTFLDLIDPAATIITTSAQNFSQPSLAQNYKLLSTAVTMAHTASIDSDNLSKLSEGISAETLNSSIADAVWLYFLGQKLKSETNNKNIGTYLTPEISRVLTIAQVAPKVLGFEGERRYLLLFQNNGELRPTGGFIGSVGELTLKNGKIVDLNLQDVYEYDGQLKVRLEPYFVVRRYLQPNLYLRDSNFNPDFQTSASSAAQLYSLEGGNKVDGVIAINYDAVKQIIGAIGPIELTTYKKTLDHNNAFEFLENTIDNNFFPGSTAKKDVLQALFDKIMLRLEDPNESAKVARMIPKLAAEKNILFAFNQNSIQSVFSSVGYGGEYKDSRIQQSGRINDYLGINEANIGVNKANINISRTTEYTAAFGSTKVSSKATHKINNTGEKGYNAFIRFIVPLGSKLTGIKIDGKVQKIIPAITDPNVYERKGFVPPTDLEVNQEVLNDKTVFGFNTIVTPKTNQTIDVEYENGLGIPNDSVVSYSLLLIKQPGVATFPFALNLIYGAGFTPKEVENARLENGVIKIEKNINEDAEMKAELLRR